MNRVQALRYSVSGVRPTVATRQPGELYVNWADNALGVIDPTQTPIDLVAVRYWSVAANYAVGDHTIHSGVLYRAIAAITAGAFNPAQWTAVAGTPEAPLDGQLYARQSAGWASINGLFLPLSGGTLTGALTLNGDPTAALGAATKQYVDAHGGGGGIPEAPNDGQQYGRQSLGWTVVATGAGIPDAPSDGTAYARKSAAWSHLAHTDITDWAATLAGYLPLSGGVMTGAMTLAADPATALQPATKQYVDAHSGGGSSGANINLIDNGDMSIAQRGTGVVAVPNGSVCAVDRWFGYATAGRYSMGQNYNGLPHPNGFANFLGVQCTSATAAGSSDYFALQQAVEGDTINGFNWGSSAAQMVALSFWACASLAGTYSGALNNGANNRSYVFTFPLVANTPTKVTAIIPGDTAGTWVNHSAAAELFLIFDLGSGSGNRSSTINSWVTGDFTGQTGAAGIIGHNGAKFAVTGVKLELGSAATPFLYDPLALRLERCQRYYAANLPIAMGISGSGGDAMLSALPFPVSMRALPTLVFSNFNYVNANGLSTETIAANGLQLIAYVTNDGNGGVEATVSCSAEI